MVLGVWFAVWFMERSVGEKLQIARCCDKRGSRVSQGVECTVLSGRESTDSVGASKGLTRELWPISAKRLYPAIEFHKYSQRPDAAATRPRRRDAKNSRRRVPNRVHFRLLFSLSLDSQKSYRSFLSSCRSSSQLLHLHLSISLLHGC